ncbi:MAG: endonuclease/exonuclease/phosphatase family protein [Burkholderiales bacterium]|nr:endonuclease/exonuclease/phosphatase family protein [Opitutaceae bacterium]
MSPALATAARAAFWTLTALALPACALTTVAYFVGEPVLFAQISPFRVQYATILAAHAVFCLALRRPRWAGVFLVFCAFNLFAVLLPAITSQSVALQETTADPPLKIILANVLTSNPDPAPLLALISAENPDLVALLEVNGRWANQLSAALLAEYPHTLLHPREDNFGLAVFSRRPLADTGAPRFADPELPSLEFTADGIRILVTHPVPPGSASTTALRNDHLDRLAAWPPSASTPALILGDLNATPWCPPLRRLLATARLRPTTGNPGFVASTWPAAVPFLRIPLDHALLNPAVACTALRVGPDIGSDHFPLVFEVRPASPPTSAHP